MAGFTRCCWGKFEIRLDDEVYNDMSAMWLLLWYIVQHVGCVFVAVEEQIRRYEHRLM